MPNIAVAVVVVNVADVNVVEDIVRVDVVIDKLELKVEMVVAVQDIVVVGVEVAVVLVTVLRVALVVDVLEVASCIPHPSKATKEKKNIRATSAGASDPNASSISSASPFKRAGTQGCPTMILSLADLVPAELQAS